MAKFTFYASTKYVNSAREETIEIPDEVLEDMTEEEIEEYVEREYFQDWLANNCELSFWREDE